MGQVGNDLVDLGDTEIAAHHRRSRFVERVCTAVEAERVARADDPHALLWSLFAAKEAAFKTVVKCEPAAIFAHRRFEVSAALDRVSYGELALTLRLERDRGCVHAVVLRDATVLVAGVRWLAANEAPSDAVRRELCAALAPALGCDEGALAVRRDPAPGGWTGAGPPYLLRDGERAPVNISLSHDGRAVAFAACRR